METHPHSDSFHQRIQAKLLNPGHSLHEKLEFLVSVIGKSCSLSDALSFFPGKVWASLYVEISTNYSKAAMIFSGLLRRRSISFFQSHVFHCSEDESLAAGKEKYVYEILVHSFLVKKMLPRAYVNLQNSKKLTPAAIFNEHIRFDAFMRKVRPGFVEKLDFDDPHYLIYYEFLLSYLETHLSRTSEKYRAIYNDLIIFVDADLQEKKPRDPAAV